MGSLVFGIFLAIVAVIILFLNIDGVFNKIKKLVATAMFLAAFAVASLGGVGYNQAGYATHIQTIFGTEDAKLNTGWYFAGWGITTSYPQYITVAHTSAGDAQGTSVNPPYQIRMADNWNGTVTQTTRFEIPRGRDAFVKMHNTFRGAESLVTRALRPAVLASLDSVANLYSMEEYYAGGKRDQFKTEYRDAITQGRARVRQVNAQRIGGGIVDGNAASSDLEFVQDQSVQENVNTRRVIMEKITDASGQPIREPHDFMRHEITVSQAILENLDPDDRFEDQIQARKDAASRRIVAQEERREQEEQRLLAIQRGQTDIAKRQAEAKVEQIEKTTNAETQKQLALIEASRLKEEAAIAQETAAINLEKARIDAEAVQVTADAEAHAKEAILLADGALAQKLDAWVKAQQAWADASRDLQVPNTVIGGTGEGMNSVNSAQTLMDLLMTNQARQLSLDPTITK